MPSCVTIERVDRELARIAREDLNMIKPGEVVFELRRPASGDQ
jgi:cell division protein FtsB